MEKGKRRKRFGWLDRVYIAYPDGVRRRFYHSPMNRRYCRVVSWYEIPETVERARVFGSVLDALNYAR